MTTSITPKKLAVYYGWPIAVNGTWSTSAATESFNEYDIVVFGSGLEDPGHSQYSTTRTIINNTTADVYGYVDATLGQTAFESKVDDWNAIGGTGSGIVGIFCDQFGFDFGLTREKQNQEIDYIHSKGLKAFVNAWNPDDVFKTQIGSAATGTSMTDSDWYLAESYQIINGAFQNTNDWKTKADKMKDYKNNGPGFSNMATVTTSGTAPYDQDKWDYAYYSTVLYGFDAAGWGEHYFSAATASLPFRSRKNVIGSQLSGALSEDNGVFQIPTSVGIKVDTNNKSVSHLLN